MPSQPVTIPQPLWDTTRYSAESASDTIRGYVFSAEKNALIQSSSPTGPIVPSPLVILSPTNSRRYSGSGRTKNSPSPYCNPKICIMCSGSWCIACTSFRIRTCFGFPTVIPRNRHTSFFPLLTGKRLIWAPSSSTASHGSIVS